MSNYKLIYFSGCPNKKQAEALLKSAGVEFELVCQDDLSDSDPLLDYSSPTLLKGREIIFGSNVTGGGCSVQLPSKDDLLKRLRG